MAKHKQEAQQENTAAQKTTEPAENHSFEELKKENETLHTQLDDFTNTLQRLQAEFENYRKRCDRNNLELIKNANEELVAKLLPILDTFELAIKSSAQKEEIHKGMELIYAQLFDTLEGTGLARIDCMGKKFDPYYHEALLSEESEQDANTVLEELQKGYLLNNRVLRHSKVKIAKKKSNTTSDTIKN